MSVRINCTKSPELTAEQAVLLKEIAGCRRYAVANFELRSSKNDEIYTGAMENVHLLEEDEPMTPVVERGELLEELKEKGLIDLTYELRSYVKSDYLIFKNSKLCTSSGLTILDSPNSATYKEESISSYPKVPPSVIAVYTVPSVILKPTN